MIRLTTTVEELHGVGPRRAAALRRLGIRCVADLLRHLPIRYERETAHESIAALAAAKPDEHVTVTGEITQTRQPRGRRPRFEAILDDGSDAVMLTWFNAPWLRGRLHPGMRIRVTGRVARYGEYLQMVNPRWEALAAGDAPPPPRPPSTSPAETDTDGGTRLRPVYPASEDVGSTHIASLTAGVLDEAVAQLDDHLHDDYRRRRELIPLADAYRMIHRPSAPAEVTAARRRLAFDELLLLQLGVMMKRHHRQSTLVAPALRWTEEIDARILERFPFTLTPGQDAVITAIREDVTKATPMNRLLQGDVGAGKTVVALYAMLLAIASERQAAMMAPTELLAEQHFASISAMLAGSRVSVELLTGSRTPRERADIETRVANGELDLLVGTHALLTEQVKFHELGVVVIDEQHRFGVHQRATLRAKPAEARSCPHVLVMTATPIPRTLSLTVFGDLDNSVIPDLPPGRQPVTTTHVPPGGATRVYQDVATRVEAGEQAYVVVPAIEPGPTGAKDVATQLTELETGPLASCRVAALHGRLPRDERERIMTAFRAGDIDVLVATTVIEVGVDVPNATMMVIENAERFGLAQLHQLRGRVGRGSAASACVLIAEPVTDDAQARLAAIVEHEDGFAIAERDLAIRGPGELFGTRQAGIAPFHAARLPDDLELLRLARRDAAEWIAENPRLEGERDALLLRRLLKAHGAALGLADVA